MSKDGAVFIVDDDPDDRLLLSEAIHAKLENIEIIEFESGTQLLAGLKGQDLDHPKLILIDMNMPALNGLETYCLLKQYPDYPHTPVVMISTASNPELVSKVYAEGINGFITKPVGLKEYEIMVQAINLSFLGGRPVSRYSPLKTNKSETIIVIEDNDDHWKLMQLSLSRSMPTVRAIRLHDKPSALKFFADDYLRLNMSAGFIVVDLYLPQRHQGLSLIEEIREFLSSNDLPVVPIIVLSHSSYQQDISACYERNANAYLTKPSEPINWHMDFNNLVYFWTHSFIVPS